MKFWKNPAVNNVTVVDSNVTVFNPVGKVPPTVALVPPYKKRRKRVAEGSDSICKVSSSSEVVPVIIPVPIVTTLLGIESDSNPTASWNAPAWIVVN